MTLAIVAQSVIYRPNRSYKRVSVKSGPLKIMGPLSHGPNIAVGLTMKYGSHIKNQTKLDSVMWRLTQSGWAPILGPLGACDLEQ